MLQVKVDLLKPDQFNEIVLIDLDNNREVFKAKWDPHFINWASASSTLIVVAPHYIDIWWDPNQFNWHLAGEQLIEALPQYFDIWFDPRELRKHDKFAKYGKLLIKYCMKDFEKWWHPRYLKSWRVVSTLCNNHPDKFDIWWDSNYYSFDWISSLIIHVPDKFEVWYTPNRILIQDHWDYIIAGCLQYQHIWGKDYIHWKLKGELDD